MVQAPQITISIVSHRQAHLVSQLLTDIDHNCGPEVEVVVTQNVQGDPPIDVSAFRARVRIIINDHPKGFGANHDAALSTARGQYYCVLNPDIHFTTNPFPELLACISDGTVGIVAPLITNTAGDIEDSARRFPTPFRIVAKLLPGKRPPEHRADNKSFSPDWVGGMFMLIPASVFREIGGFDERYFLYYEDVDLCARMRLAGYDIRLCPNARVIHEARRQSHRDLRYFRWHFASMLRFFFSKPFLLIMWRRWKNGKP